ncbi:MAG: hypothetical protein AB2693_11215 [Candidatus Thiodiazotropha sp.]
MLKQGLELRIRPWNEVTQFSLIQKVIQGEFNSFKDKKPLYLLMCIIATSRDRCPYRGWFTSDVISEDQTNPAECIISWLIDRVLSDRIFSFH